MFNPTIAEWMINFSDKLIKLSAEHKLLIDEDSAFLNEIFSSQNDFNYDKDKYFNKRTNKIWLLIILFIYSLIGYWYFSDNLYIFLTSSLLIFLLPFSIKSVIKKYINYLLMHNAKNLCIKIKLLMDVLKNFFKSIEDAEVVDKSEYHSTKTKEIKTLYYNYCKEVFLIFKSETTSLYEKNNISDKYCDQLICNLPNETFMIEEHLDLTLRNLKAFLQLVRLQQSEFIKVFISSFIPIFKKENVFVEENIFDFYKNHKKTSSVLEKMIVKLNFYYFELNSMFISFKSIWMSFVPNNKENHKENFQKSNLLNSIRSMRVHLISMLNNIEQLEEAIQINDIVNGNEKLNITKEQMKNFEELFYFLENNLKIKGDNNSKLILPTHENSSKETKIINLNEIYCAPEDEVFEAFVNDNENDVYRQNEDEEISIKDLKSLQENEASVNLFKELKNALKIKAKEHRIREAKALGINVDEIENEQSSILEEEKQHSDEQDKNEKLMSYKFDKNYQNENIIHLNNTLIADILAVQSRIFAINTEECFGDDEDIE